MPSESLVIGITVGSLLGNHCLAHLALGSIRIHCMSQSKSQKHCKKIKSIKKKLKNPCDTAENKNEIKIKIRVE